MSGSSVTYYYDQLTNTLIDGDNVSSAILTTSYPKIFRNNEHYILRGYIYSDASAISLANLASQTLSAKIGVVGSTALITASSASFNNIADWSAANASAGAICFYINTSGTAIDTALGSLESKTYTCNINGNDTDGDDRTIAQFYVTLTNTPD